MVDSANVSTVKSFYEIADGRIPGDLPALFADDVQIFAPKFGIGCGREAMLSAGKGQAQFVRIAHHVDEFDILEYGNRVIVEGTTEGETSTGRKWDGRQTIAGRFCTVFEFRDSLICRMHVYFDPDLGHEDTARYPWWFPQGPEVANA